MSQQRRCLACLIAILEKWKIGSVCVRFYISKCYLLCFVQARQKPPSVEKFLTRSELKIVFDHCNSAVSPMTKAGQSLSVAFSLVLRPGFCLMPFWILDVREDELHP